MRPTLPKSRLAAAPRVVRGQPSRGSFVGLLGQVETDLLVEIRFVTVAVPEAPKAGAICRRVMALLSRWQSFM